MSKLIEFAFHHWVLWLALVAIIFLIITEEARSKVSGVRKITPQDSINLINKENALILDIRAKDAFSEGHIANAKNMPNNDSQDYPAKLNNDKNRPILVVCYAGVSSLKAAQLLKKAGFDKIYSLQGGMNAWKSANLPVVKG